MIFPILKYWPLDKMHFYYFRCYVGQMKHDQVIQACGLPMAGSLRQKNNRNKTFQTQQAYF